MCIRDRTQAALDQAVTGCQAGDDNCVCSESDPKQCVLTTDSVVASYYEEEIQVTGLNVSEVKDVEVGLFGTTAPATSADPNQDDEDKVMMQLMGAGLAGTFLYTTTAITELAANFEKPAWFNSRDKRRAVPLQFE
jgi:hypothetical protein